MATVSAPHSFTAISQSGISDPFLAIYVGSFDPANPTTNLVGCNDDANALLPAFISTLTAGTTYVMVATRYQSGSFGGTVTFETGVTPTINLAPLSGTVGATGLSMVATSNSTTTLSYASSNPAVATIDPATGALTLLTAGTTTITASQPAEVAPGLYAAGSQTALLTVTAAPVVPAAIPTLSEWGLIFMASILGMVGLARVRRRS